MLVLEHNVSSGDAELMFQIGNLVFAQKLSFCIQKLGFWTRMLVLEHNFSYARCITNVSAWKLSFCPETKLTF
jgi:hypothetical protein